MQAQCLALQGIAEHFSCCAALCLAARLTWLGALPCRLLGLGWGVLDLRLGADGESPSLLLIPSPGGLCSHMGACLNMASAARFEAVTNLACRTTDKLNDDS